MLSNLMYDEEVIGGLATQDESVVRLWTFLLGAVLVGEFISLPLSILFQGQNNEPIPKPCVVPTPSHQPPTPLSFSWPVYKADCWADVISLL